MKSSPLFPSLLFLFSLLLFLPAKAQIAIQASFERLNFIPYETITLNITVNNQSGRPITYGKHNGQSWLQVELKDIRGRRINNNSQIETDPFVLRNGESRTYSIKLNGLTDLTQVGSYRAIVSVYYPPLDQTYQTSPQRFQVRDGLKIWERRIGIAPQGAIEGQHRNYELLQAQINEFPYLFVRISDPVKARYYASYPIGALVAHTPPQVALDPQGVMHVVYRATADRWVYQRIDHMGNLLEDRVMAAKGGNPLLDQFENGQVSMTGPPTIDEQRQLDALNDPNRLREADLSLQPDGIQFRNE